MPSQKQLRWAQLRVGLTVVFASLVLGFLVFLMSGTTGWFSPNLRVVCFVDNANGLRNGAPVRLSDVDIGNVERIRIVDHHDAEGNRTPVQIVMRINSKFQPFLHTDSKVLLSTSGVLGESYVDIDSNQATGPVVSNYAELQSETVPQIQDVVRSSQTTLQNVNALLARLDNIVGAVETQKGSVGKLIYDQRLYNDLTHSVAQVNSMLTDINNGRGSIGKLMNDDTLYNRANETIDKLNKTADAMNNGNGSVSKFLHDPSLYDNANQTLAKANQLMDGINRGEGALGKLAKDPEFAKRLDLLIANLSTISSDLEAGKGSAGKLLKDPTLYDNSNKMLVDTQDLVQAIRKDPKKYLSIKLHIF